MKIIHLRRALAPVFLLRIASVLLPVPALAHEYYAKSFKIIHPWALPAERSEKTAAVYVKFEEIFDGDRLVGVRTPLAEAVEIRQAGRSDTVPTLDLPAGKTIDLQPQGTHLLMVNLTGSLEMGRNYPMTLQFEKSGNIAVQLSVGSH
ncbi:MAG: copper chaperone PCu(A)C [Pseudomonadota bacterium]